VTKLLLVSGLGRCGSTLLMQMLAAGGYPLVPGASEVGHEHPVNVGVGRLPDDASGALKWLDPQRWAPPPRGCVLGSVLLTREVGEQARSLVKFLRALGEPCSSSEKTIKRFAASLKADVPRALRVLTTRGPVLPVRFELLVEHPVIEITHISEWLGADIDAEAAAQALRPRVTGAACLPHMLEAELIRKSKSEATITEDDHG
jgi:hypothetical protein